MLISGDQQKQGKSIEVTFSLTSLSVLSELTVNVRRQQLTVKESLAVPVRRAPSTLIYKHMILWFYQYIQPNFKHFKY